MVLRDGQVLRNPCVANEAEPECMQGASAAIFFRKPQSVEQSRFASFYALLFCCVQYFNGLFVSPADACTFEAI